MANYIPCVLVELPTSKASRLKRIVYPEWLSKCSLQLHAKHLTLKLGWNKISLCCFENTRWHFFEIKCSTVVTVVFTLRTEFIAVIAYQRWESKMGRFWKRSTLGRKSSRESAVDPLSCAGGNLTLKFLVVQLTSVWTRLCMEWNTFVNLRGTWPKGMGHYDTGFNYSGLRTKIYHFCYLLLDSSGCSASSWGFSLLAGLLVMFG